MKKLLIIIGENFIGTPELYQYIFSNFKSEYTITNIPVVSYKKIVGVPDAIISDSLFSVIKDNSWAFPIPGQPGYCIINDIIPYDIGILTVPARGKDTASLISNIQTVYSGIEIIPIILLPHSIDGALMYMLKKYKLTDKVAMNILQSYLSNKAQWIDDITFESISPLNLSYQGLNTLLTRKTLAQIYDRINTNKGEILS